MEKQIDNEELHTLLACWLVLKQYPVYSDAVDQRCTENQLRDVIWRRLEYIYDHPVNKETLQTILADYLRKKNLKVVA